MARLDRKRVAASLLIVTVLFFVTVAFFPEQFVRYQEPNFLTFDELKSLITDPEPKGRLGFKLNQFWRTPVINNEAYYGGLRPYRPARDGLGPIISLASWNIEKSYRIKDAIKAFGSEKNFSSLIDLSKTPPGSNRFRQVLAQRQRLAHADIIVLQEMEIGVKRSGYIDAARELAKALRMNYAYGAEQLEIDPVLLGLEKVQYESGGVDDEATEFFRADPLRYKGVFGCAVLSRYPITHVEVFQLKNQAYDWHTGEKNQISFLEKTRRVGAKTVFQNELTREIKVGGRIYLRVDLRVPGLPEHTLTVINIHLEIKCLPEGRRKQMEEILSYIKSIRHPVIVVGDFNSAPEDLSPTSVPRATTRLAKNPETWVTLGTNAVLPHAAALNATRFLSKFTKNFQNPMASHIPVVAPNKVKPLFDMIENFRFEDGGTLDFRGDENRSVNGKDGALANSNQRDFKGFKTTFSVKRPIGPLIGKYRLDWIFVKSFLKDPRDKFGPYRFAPHFGETLEEMNTSLIVPISDHHPNVVDIPFEEPTL